MNPFLSTTLRGAAVRMWEIIHLDNSKKRDEDVSFYSEKEYIWEGAPLRGDSVGSKKNAIVMRA